MLKNEFYTSLCMAAGGESFVSCGEEMKKHTTFRVGGPAKYFVTPESETALAATVRLCKKEGISYYILGNGSNLLVSDAGFDGVMIAMGNAFCDCEIDAEDADTYLIKAGAGILLSRIAKAALEKELTGFEFAAGIPGTLGGAVVMNAGAYGGEIKDIFVYAKVMDAEGNFYQLTGEELDLSYRHSNILEKGYIVVSALLRLTKGEKTAIKARMDELAAARREKQPLEYPSAGSTFKRPEGYFAGKLIEDAGLRGFTVGGAQVSEKHCGFVINRDGATAADICALVEAVQEKVKAQFGVDLECEIRKVGW